MTSTMKFEHAFEKEPRYGELSDNLFETPSDATIEFSTGDDGIWIAANKEGFLHLARIFAELGTRELAKGYHFHKPEWFREGAGSKQEVSVEVLHA